MTEQTNPRTIHVPVTLEGITRIKDKSVNLKFSTTREISTEEMTIMDSFHQSAGHLMFRENQFDEQDIPKEDVDVDISKSQSTQLRDALWVLFKAKGNNTQDKEKWNMFYRQSMQVIKAKVLDTVHELEGK
jgi:hypothetical protein